MSLLDSLRTQYTRHPIALPAVLLALWLALSIGWRTLAMPDEGRYSLIALDMALQNQWLEPLLNGLPFFHKPPLFYWINAIAFKLLGASSWAARTSSFVAGWAMGMAFYLFVRRHIGQQMAWVSLLLLATMPFFFGGAQFANLDMLVAVCVGLTILAGAHAVLQHAHGLPYRAWAALAWVLAALGILSKGLIGAALPCGVLLLWLLWMRHWRGLWVLLSLPGMVLFALVGVPWFALMQQRYPGFAYYFFIAQQFHRFSGADFNNQQGAWFYPALLFGMGLPATLWLLPAVGRWWSWLRVQGLAGWLAQRAQPVPLTSPAAAYRLCWCWLGLIVVFFSIPASKTVGYILPVLPPLALLLALAVQGPAGDWPVKRLLASVLGGAALCLTLVGVFTAIPRSAIQTLLPTLRPAIQPQDTLVMLDTFQFDLPFYLQWKKPVLLVGDWKNPALRTVDDWRNYMLDAADFSPTAASRIMLTPEQLTTQICATLPAGARVWVLAPGVYEGANPSLSSSNVFWTQPRKDNPLKLWRVQGDVRGQMGCK